MEILKIQFKNISIKKKTVTQDNPQNSLSAVFFPSAFLWWKVVPMRTFHSLYFILSKVLRLLILKRDAAVEYFKCNLSLLCASHNAICLYDARVQKLFFWSLVLSQG